MGSPVTWVKPLQIHMVEEGDERVEGRKLLALPRSFSELPGGQNEQKGGTSSLALWGALCITRVAFCGPTLSITEGCAA